MLETYPIRFTSYNDTVWRNMTDINKYKSVAVKVPIWNKLQAFAGQDFRSVGKVIEFLVDKEQKIRSKRKAKNGAAA